MTMPNNDSPMTSPDASVSRRGEALTFRALREANIARRDVLLRAKKPDFRLEDEWSLNDWMTALTGEVGEAANLLKKVRRGDHTLDSIRNDLADELADVQTYLDLLAYAAGIDLGEATAAKWNRVAERIDYPGRLVAVSMPNATDHATEPCPCGCGGRIYAD